MDSATGLGYEWNRLNKFIDQEKCRLDCHKCYTGCPHGAKWTARNFALEAEEAGVHILSKAKVRRVILKNNRATGVVFKHKGEEKRAFASKIILAAGGLGTPMILRRSGILRAGYDFFVDPLVIAFGVFDNYSSMGEVPMTGGMHLEDQGIMLTDLAVHPSVYLGFTAQVMRFDKLLSHEKVMGIMVKIRDDLGGRLTDFGGIRKLLQEPDRKRLDTGYRMAKRILSHAGAKECFKSWTIAGHPGGTAKIGDVVDNNLMTEKQNLYVCDCSVIPEAWGLPPSYTLLCLGRRLAKHLSA